MTARWEIFSAIVTKGGYYECFLGIRYTEDAAKRRVAEAAVWFPDVSYRKVR